MKQDSPFVDTKGHAPDGLSRQDRYRHPHGAVVTILAAQPLRGYPVSPGATCAGGAFGWLRQPPALRCVPVADQLRRPAGRIGRKVRKTAPARPGRSSGRHADPRLNSVCATGLLVARSAGGASVCPRGLNARRWASPWIAGNPGRAARMRWVLRQGASTQLPPAPCGCLRAAGSLRSPLTTETAGR